MVRDQLYPRNSPGLAERFARSADSVDGTCIRTQDVPAWLADRAAAHRFLVRRIPFAELDGWSFEPGSGNLRHASGRFFSVQGARASFDAPHREWQQPIIVQPEIGILGILAREFNGVLHFLMQAKAEPGNLRAFQLSPTVQATRSNYTRVHRGADVRYLDYFLQPTKGTVIADVLQSEHGTWFYRKSNRNMIIEVREDVPPHADYQWFTLGQIGALLCHDNMVNMDARSVLACAPIEHHEPGALWSDTDLLSWITEERSRREFRTERIPLAKVTNWERDDFSVHHRSNQHFRVVAVAVEAGNREVTRWTQPLLEPVQRGIVAFFLRWFNGVPHVLAHARAEAGLHHVVELGPTVQSAAPGDAREGTPTWPPFLMPTLMDLARPYYGTVHSEEGGRFLNAESRYLIVEAEEATAPANPPPGYRWVTPGQLRTLVRYGHYVNVQARSLLAVINASPALRPHPIFQPL